MSTDPRPDHTNKSKVSSERPTNAKYVIDELQLGIWKVFLATQKRVGRWGLLPEIWETYPLIMRLVVDIYKLAPRLLYLLLLSKCWNGIKLALEMRLENMLLAQVSKPYRCPIALCAHCLRRSSMLFLLKRPMST